VRPASPHVVLVAMFFPPSRASGVYRALAMANHLVRAGWRVTVVTVAEDFFDSVVGSRDDSLLAAVDPRIQVVRVPFPATHLIGDARRMGWLRTTFPFVHRFLNKALERWVFPERYARWIWPVVRVGRRIDARDPVDVVVATGNPWASFAAAWALGRIRRIPYVLDYRDSWTLDLFNEADAYPPGHLARRWERRVLRGASAAYFVNEALRAWHAERYPAAGARFGVLPNGYDAAFVDPAEPRPVPETGVRIGFVGTVTDRYPHAAMWEGWELARRDPALAGATVEVHGHLGFFEAAAERVASMMPLSSDSGVHYRGPVAKADVARVYESFDVILLIAADSRFVTSGKVFECMATGKPIVGVFSPRTAIAEPLAGYPLAFTVAELTPEAVAEAIVAAVHGARTATPADHERCREHAARYERGAVLAPFDARLREVAGRG
jgi:glycosyltransferase involved in cell wall biosynthesis